MSLASEIRPKLLAGLFCPSASEVSLEFLLTSDILGEATEILTIPIIPVKAAAEVDLGEKSDSN